MPIDPTVYAARRREALRRAGRGLLLVPSAPVAIRNNDVEHEYRQDSDLYYLTGFAEPASVLLLSADAEGEPRATLFVRERDREREIWDGYRAGLEGAVADYGVDEALPIDQLDALLPGRLTGVRRLHYRLGRDAAFDARVLAAIESIRGQARRGVAVPTEIIDPGVVLHEMRLFKDADELASMRAAADITRRAHVGAMAVARPGAFEYEVEAELLRVFRAGGSPRVAYGSIVGSGPNATVLHYRSNDRRMQEGDLLLIDAGCELDHYASDVTRTFPVGGRFSPAQRALYALVLASQEAAIAAVRPGATMGAVHEAAVAVLVEGMASLGLVQESAEQSLASGSYRAFYMHKTSHYLGMDVHDVGDYFVGGEERPLAPGMVITVEPGIYVGVDADAPAEYRGIGIRIEDDVLVTEAGHENLTAHIPKGIEEIEAILAAR